MSALNNLFGFGTPRVGVSTSARSLRRLGPFPIAGFVLGLWSVGIPGCDRGSSEVRRQAILFLLDAGRPDRFSCYGYEHPTTPEMDRLAASGVVFRQHFAQATATRGSLSSLIYSRFYCLPLFPNSPQVPYARPSNLFRRPDDAQISFVKILEAEGIKTAAISAHIWTGEKTAFADEFGEMHDLATRFADRERPYPSAEEVIDYAINWIRKNKDQDYFLYVHLMDTHMPHFFDQDAQEFFGSPTYDTNRFLPGGVRTVPDSALTEEDRRYVNALYDGSMRYTDRHIGRLAAFLRKENLLADTLIAITADHGEHLFDQPGGKTREGVSVFTHGGPWWDPVARIPLILHYPRKLEPGEFTHLSEGVDLGPTLLGLLDVSVPAGKSFDGIDLVQVINGYAPPKDHILKRRCIRTASYKCLFGTSDDVLLGDPPPDVQALTGKLYDLATDPGETTDLFQAKPEVVGELLQQYRKSMVGLFQRYQAAQSSQQPTSAFAIAARHMNTDVLLADATGRPLPDGWSRRRTSSESFIVAKNSHEPLSVHFPLPNGRYLLSLKMQGHIMLEVGDERRELTARGVVEFGVINVTDEVFRAIIRPLGERPAGLAFFGFIPPGATILDDDAVREQLERLRALGYVE